MNDADNGWCGFEDLDPREVCIRIADSLPHPAVFLDYKGRLDYKNNKFSWLGLKWRVGASIENYIGKDNSKAVLSTEIRDYNAFFVNNIPSVSLRMGNYFFIVFISDFELNKTYVTCIYDYIDNAVERILSQLAKMKEGAKCPQHSELCNAFEKKLKHFFDDKSMYGRNARGLLLGDKYEKRHRIEDVLKMIEALAQKSFWGNKCGVTFKEHKNIYDLYVCCSPEELGVVLSMMFFSCIICSSSKNPHVEISYLKNKKIDAGEITFSAKSNVEEKVIQSIMATDEYVDEKSIYFKSIQAFALKNQWTFKAYRSGGKLCFSLAVTGKRLAPFALSDAVLESTLICVQAFEKFFAEVLSSDALE